MSGQQIPNLQAGFRNNIGPQQVELPPPPSLQHMVPRAPAEIQIAGVDENVINVLGMAFQKKYFYLFVGLIVLVAGYFLWKWYSGKGGKKKRYVNDDDEDDEDDDDEDDESFDMLPNQNQLLMQQMLQQQQLQQMMAQKNLQQNNQAQESQNQQ
ncbi:hypothetical protein Klosneuvirus_2_153 [Klosneuvirus KNV1]|uniref:Uncharacterized protein n=1 Tax=Klosneuvirus KNV1 TaxID=1977640 RepID=A0A1V0SJ18_9VIRU|nr:hypothetical protein Klosneuvirus_2_153 [Klosneuvirus KNV1]